MVSYDVTSNSPTKHYDNYDDALEKFNLHWMKENTVINLKNTAPPKW